MFLLLAIIYLTHSSIWNVWYCFIWFHFGWKVYQHKTDPYASKPCVIYLETRFDQCFGLTVEMHRTKFGQSTYSCILSVARLNNILEEKILVIKQKKQLCVAWRRVKTRGMRAGVLERCARGCEFRQSRGNVWRSTLAEGCGSWLKVL